jgi:hypothetical protein
MLLLVTLDVLRYRLRALMANDGSRDIQTAGRLISLLGIAIDTLDVTPGQQMACRSNGCKMVLVICITYQHEKGEYVFLGART